MAGADGRILLSAKMKKLETLVSFVGKYLNEVNQNVP
jgi:hypothetical protein